MNNSVAFAGLPQGTDGSDALVGVNLGGGDGAAALGSAFFHGDFNRNLWWFSRFFLNGNSMGFEWELMVIHGAMIEI